MSIYDTLNPPQREAVAQTEGTSPRSWRELVPARQEC